MLVLHYAKERLTLLLDLLGPVGGGDVLVLEEDAEDLGVGLGGGPVEVDGAVVIPGGSAIGVGDGNVGWS